MGQLEEHDVMTVDVPEFGPEIRPVLAWAESSGYQARCDEFNTPRTRNFIPGGSRVFVPVKGYGPWKRPWYGCQILRPIALYNRHSWACLGMRTSNVFTSGEWERLGLAWYHKINPSMGLNSVHAKKRLAEYEGAGDTELQHLASAISSRRCKREKREEIVVD